MANKKPIITEEPVRTLEVLAQPKVALATAKEMESLIRERQGYKAQEKVALGLIANRLGIKFKLVESEKQ